MLLTVDLERLDIQPGHRLLDAGCGEGRHCFGSIYRGATVVGLDLDFDSMRDASKNLRARGEERVALRSLRRFVGLGCAAPTGNVTKLRS